MLLVVSQTCGHIDWRKPRWPSQGLFELPVSNPAHQIASQSAGSGSSVRVFEDIPTDTSDATF